MDEPSDLEIQQTRARAEAGILAMMQIRKALALKRQRGESYYFAQAAEWAELLYLADEDGEHLN